MNDEERHTYGMYKATAGFTPGPATERGAGPRLMGTDTLIGNDVYNRQESDLGEIKEIMLDVHGGRVAYAALSFGGFLGMGGKLFAVPWNAPALDTEYKRFVLDIDKERPISTAGFDKNHWPNMADPPWTRPIHSCYGTKPYPDAPRH